MLREPLITFGSAPFENPFFRSALFEQLGSERAGSAGDDRHRRQEGRARVATRPAKPGTRSKRPSLHRKAAATIFFESNGGMSQSKAEASLPEIRTDVGSPELNLVDLDNVLESLVSTCYYLNQDRNRYQFGLTPNLNQILVTRRGAVLPKEIDERIKKQTQELFDRGPDKEAKDKDEKKKIVLDRKYSPERSQDVPNRPILTLVVLGLDHTAGDPATAPLMEAIVRDCGSSGRTYKSALIFAVADGAEPIREATRDLLAWEAIEEDTDTTQRLDEAQKRLMVRNLGRAKSDMKEAIWRAYHHVYLLGKDNSLRPVDLRQINSSMAGSLVELYLAELERTDEITPGVGANKLLKYWPPALTEWSTKGVRDAFYSSPQLPRLLNPDTIKRTIADGVSQGMLGYATKDERGQLNLVHFDKSLSEADVEIADDVFLLKADDARKLLEPPRLARLTIRPDQVTLRQGQQASFMCGGIDQYGHPIDIAAPNWTATGGTISAGLYAAAKDGPTGLFTVRAELDGREAIAEVRLISAIGPDPDDDSGGSDETRGRTIRWQGEVPPQKWMNFYTKVLSRFASIKGLKLKVSFEAPVEPDQATAKADETRAGLKELGLDDNLPRG